MIIKNLKADKDTKYILLFIHFGPNGLVFVWYFLVKFRAQ